MFISKSKTSFSSLIGILLCLVGGGHALFWFLGVIMTLTGEIDSLDNDVTTAVISLFISLVGAFAVYIGIRKIRFVSKAKMLDNIFRGDMDGEIPLSRIALLMGMSDDDFFRLFHKLISKGYIINASLNNEGGNFRIVLNGGTSQNVQYIVVKCADCGAGITVRKGFVGKCNFCGSDVKG